MAFAGDPRFGPLAISLSRAWLASGRLCRRPSGGRMFEAAVLHLLRADNSAGLAGMASAGLKARRAGTDGIHGVRLLLGIERSKGKRQDPFHGQGRAAEG